MLLCRTKQEFQTAYSSQEQRQCGPNSNHEDDGEETRGEFGILPENMVDLGPFAVAQGLWDGGRWHKRILLDVDIEGVGNESLGRAKRANDDGGMEGLAGREELGWEVLLGLFVACDN